MKVLVVGIIVVVFISGILKLLNILYNQKYKKKEMSRSINLFSETPSYKQFEKVSKESSVLNSPIRKQGDFMDFIIESLSFSDDGIEGRILSLNYGEEYEN